MSHRTLAALFVGLLAFVGCTPGGGLPADALVGTDHADSQIIWSSGMNRWSEVLGDGSALQIFQVRRTDTSQVEYRALLRIDSQRTVYLGPLAPQLGDAPLQTIMFRVGDERFIAGRVDDSVPGKLAFVDLQRHQPDGVRWTEATRRSEVANRVFLIPIDGADAVYWDALERVSVQSEESLSRGVANLEASGSEWERHFDPPFEIALDFIQVSY